MTTFELGVSVAQEGLARLEPKGGVNSVHFPYFFKLRCYNCNDTSREVTLHIDDEEIVFKCKCCRRAGSVTLLKGQGQPMVFSNNSAGGFTPLVRFFVRDFEPVEYCFNGGWEGISTNGDEVFVNLLTLPFVNDDGPVKVRVTSTSYVFRIIHN